MKTKICIDEEKQWYMSISSSCTAFPSCCGINIYSGISVGVLNIHNVPHDVEWNRLAAKIRDKAEERKDFIFEEIEKAMMRESKNRGLICVSDGVYTRNLEPKSIWTMANFVKSRKWDESPTVPNPVHGGATSVFLAWKVVGAVESKKVSSGYNIVKDVNEDRIANMYGNSATIVYDDEHVLAL